MMRIRARISDDIKFYLSKVFPVSGTAVNAPSRETWIAEVLQRIPAGSRLLDAGAGELAHKKYCEHLRYVSQDFAQYAGDGDGKGLQTGSWDQSQLDIVSDITDIPEPDASFDAIMCTEVFEHLPDPLAAVDEFARLLKPDGYLILTAPFCSFTHMAPYFFGTGFSPYWYETHLPKRGLTILELAANGNFTEFMMQEVERIPFIAEKYTGVTPTRVERIGLRIVQSLLHRMHRADNTSHEFSCFGYHILAQKSV